MPRPKLAYASDDDVVAEVRRRLQGGDTVQDLAKSLGVSYQFLSGYLRRTWPHAQPQLLVSLGYEPRRYYRRKRR